MKTCFILFLVVAVAACTTSTDNTSASSRREGSVQKYSIPTFADSSAFARLKDFQPVVDKLFSDYATGNHFPSVAYGVIANDKMVFSGATGMSNVEDGTKATTKSLYRIASMSKSFTAMSILKLRDEGKLSLGDRASKYIPEIDQMGSLTSDAAAITIQNLLTMSAGFPEDNPWGDRQLADSDKELLDMISEGISFSNVPGVKFEYSNLGFALLGKIITSVSGMPYQQYITDNILKPIGMNDSRWEYGDVSKETLALGYRWEDEQWKVEPILHDGSYGAMGGLICSIEDFAKYVSLHITAWPPRNTPDNGPVKRSTIREMHQLWRIAGVAPQNRTRTGELCPAVGGYSYGLGWRQDCNGVVRVSHSGGLPGFGSEWRFYPEYGVGIVSFSNHTYGAPGRPNAVALDTLIQLAGIQPRTLASSDILEKRKAEIVAMLPDWNVADQTIFAENFFPDADLARRKAETQKIFAEIGKPGRVSILKPENQLRGTFMIEGEKKNVRIFFTLTPEKQALIQQLDIELEEKVK